MQDTEKDTVKAEDIEGYRGNKDIDSILQFIDGPNSELSGKKHKKNSTVTNTERERNRKNKKDSVGKEEVVRDTKEENNKEKRKKKEKSVDKETVIKKIDNVKTGDIVISPTGTRVR